jgi:nucleotide-binding universal stress UspA family protein
MLTLRRPRAPTLERPGGAAGRDVLLATLGVPFDPAAASLAVGAAVESGSQLTLLNVVEMVLGPGGITLGLSWELESETDAAALAAPAVLASTLGVAVERLRVCSPHPIDALIEVVAERSPGLLVFGPDRSRLRPRRYRRAAKAVRDCCPCLVWLAE